MEDLHQPYGYEGRDHHKFALGEVHDIHGVEDQDETESDQTVNRPHRKPGYQHLQISRQIHSKCLHCYGRLRYDCRSRLLEQDKKKAEAPL